MVELFIVVIDTVSVSGQGAVTESDVELIALYNAPYGPLDEWLVDHVLHSCRDWWL